MFQMAVKFICICNQMGLEPEVSRPMKRLAMFGAQLRSTYSGKILQRFDDSPIEVQAAVVRRLYGKLPSLTAATWRM